MHNERTSTSLSSLPRAEQLDRMDKWNDAERDLVARGARYDQEGRLYPTQEQEDNLDYQHDEEEVEARLEEFLLTPQGQEIIAHQDKLRGLINWIEWRSLGMTRAAKREWINDAPKLQKKYEEYLKLNRIVINLDPILNTSLLVDKKTAKQAINDLAIYVTQLGKLAKSLAERSDLRLGSNVMVERTMQSGEMKPRRERDWHIEGATAQGRVLVVKNDNTADKPIQIEDLEAWNPPKNS